MIEIKFFANGDESGQVMTMEFETWEQAEEFKTSERKSIEIFSEKKIGE